MKTITDSKENIEKTVAERVLSLVSEKPDAAIGFAWGRSLEGVYALLKGSLDTVKAFSVCEYVGDDCISRRLTEAGIKNLHRPDENAPERYDAEIAAAGGLDLLLLGVGLNGHIGFNEPATPYDSRTHIQQLTDSTRRMKAADFAGEVPEKGVTMGLKTICSAKDIILVAFGEEKADIVHKLVYGRTDTYIPAAMLQLPMNMTLCLDPEAAAKL